MFKGIQKNVMDTKLTPHATERLHFGSFNYIFLVDTRINFVQRTTIIVLNHIHHCLRS